MTGPGVFGALAEEICRRRLGHPVRVAVDGITAAGKTTFADHLADQVRSHGRPALRVSMDGFHNPRAVRHRRGRASADGYYEDAYDLGGFRREVLAPLGPGGDGSFRPAVIALASDGPAPDRRSVVPPHSVVIVDGSFLQKPDLRPAWDVVVYLRTSFAAAERRGVARDADALGGTAAATAMFRSRYHAAQRRYLEECDPERSADVVVDVEDVAAPYLVPPSSGGG